MSVSGVRVDSGHVLIAVTVHSPMQGTFYPNCVTVSISISQLLALAYGGLGVSFSGKRRLDPVYPSSNPGYGSDVH